GDNQRDKQQGGEQRTAMGRKRDAHHVSPACAAMVACNAQRRLLCGKEESVIVVVERRGQLIDRQNQALALIAPETPIGIGAKSGST
ncbi:hypothetical protein ACSTLN_23625, partial [Vibrio parahaemolyticus]